MILETKDGDHLFLSICVIIRQSALTLERDARTRYLIFP